MNDTTLHPVAPLQPGTAAGTAVAPPPGGDSLPFQRLLDSVQRLAEARQRTEGGDDAERLQDALRVAEDGFVTAMDLRQKLEAAFRAHRP